MKYAHLKSQTRYPHDQCTYQVCWKSIAIYLLSSKMKIWMCGGQITLSKICPLAIPNQISTILMYMPSFLKIHCYLLKLSSKMKIQMCGGQITLSEIGKICTLAIPNQTSTISMHIQSLVIIIHWYLLKLSSGNKVWMDRLLTLLLPQAIITGFCKQHRSRWDG